jgi:hypothetical protein
MEMRYPYVQISKKCDKINGNLLLLVGFLVGNLFHS